MKKIITMGTSVCFLLLAGSSFGQQELRNTPTESVKTEPKKLEKNSNEGVQAKSLNASEKAAISTSEVKRSEEKKPVGQGEIKKTIK